MAVVAISTPRHRELVLVLAVDLGECNCLAGIHAVAAVALVGEFANKRRIIFRMMH